MLFSQQPGPESRASGVKQVSEGATAKRPKGTNGEHGDTKKPPNPGRPEYSKGMIAYTRLMYKLGRTVPVPFGK